MDANERDLKLARLVKSEYGPVLKEVITIWTDDILAKMENPQIPPDLFPILIGAYRNMREFKNHIFKTPEVVDAKYKLRELEENITI